ncbi:MAG: hypothetical protein ABI705_10350 [Aestuariivirga sp.]
MNLVTPNLIVVIGGFAIDQFGFNHLIAYFGSLLLILTLFIVVALSAAVVL